MLHDNEAFAAFYRGHLGQTARRLIRRQLRLLVPDSARHHTLAYGFASPYRAVFSKGDAGFAPENRHFNRSLVMSPLAESRIDAEDGAFDRLLLIHALEYAAAPNLLLTEARRVLADHGRLIVVVPNRHGLWAQAETTPFGHGTPYSSAQLRRLLHEEHFTLEDLRRALFSPPVDHAFGHYCASGLETVFGRVFRGFAGVFIGIARKNIYAPTGVVTSGRRMGFDLPKTLLPLPV